MDFDSIGAYLLDYNFGVIRPFRIRIPLQDGIIYGWDESLKTIQWCRQTLHWQTHLKST